MSRRMDDPVLLRAAAAALKALSKREQDLLRQIWLERRSLDEISRANMIGPDRAGAWIQEARSRFADKLAIELERGGLEREELPPILDKAEHFAVAALRLSLATEVPTVELPLVATCPKCGAGFRDPSGQFGAYSKLAGDGRLALMIGCTSCQLLFVPVPPGETALKKRKR